MSTNMKSTMQCFFVSPANYYVDKFTCCIVSVSSTNMLTSVREYVVYRSFLMVVFVCLLFCIVSDSCIYINAITS